MKAWFTALALAAFALSAYATDDKKADDKKPAGQQSKMSQCNTEAKDKGMKGDERKAFMKECLSKKA